VGAAVIAVQLLNGEGTGEGGGGGGGMDC